MEWLPVVGTLAGAIIGSAGTVLGHRTATRAAAEHNRVQRRAALRTERKAALDAFLDAAQEAEKAASSQEETPLPDKARAGHHLWSCHKRLAIVSSEELTASAEELARLLTRCLWDGMPPGEQIYPRTREVERRFLQAAKSEVAWQER